MLVMGCCIENIRVDMDEKDGWQDEEDMEDHKAKEEVWTMMDEWKGTKAKKVHSDLDCSEDNVNFDMVVILGVSFG